MFPTSIVCCGYSCHKCYVYDVNNKSKLFYPHFYQQKTLYFLTIQATDQGAPPRSSQASVYFNIIDVNDNSPVFLPDRYSEEVAEDVAIGTSILSVTATDNDSGRWIERIIHLEPN